MAGTKIRLTWGNPEVEGARWRFGLFALKPAGGSDKPGEKLSRRKDTRSALHVSLRTITLSLSALALAGYFAAAYGLLYVQEKNPYNRITYGDLALPWRWSALDAKRGAALIDQARAELKAGQIAAGSSRLRMGLERNPTDSEARMELARIYLLRRLRTHSDRVLMEAFDHGYPGIEYVVKSYRMVVLGDASEKELSFLKAARSARAAASALAADEQVMDGLLIETLLRMDRHEEAVQIGRRLYPDNSSSRLELEITVALAGGDTAGAAAFADQWRALKPASVDVLIRAADVYRQAGRHADMQACIDRLRQLAPVNPVYVSLNIVQNIRAGRDEIAGAALNDGLFRFGSDIHALAVWSRDIAETGRGDFLVRMEAFMQEQGHNLNSVLFARLLAQIRTRDWPAARELVVRIRGREAAMPEPERRRLDVITGLAMACADAGGAYQQVFLAAYQRSPFGLDFTRMMIEALLDANRPETAGQLITFAEGIYPESDYLGKASERVKERLLVLADQREKERPVASVSQSGRFADSAALFAELKRLGEGGKAEEGLRIARAVVKSPPAWFTQREEEALGLLELDLALRSNDLTMLQFTVRNYLRGSTDKKQRTLLKLASDWQRAGRKVEPLLVVREVLKVRPDSKEALGLLNTWDPKPLPVAEGTP